MKKFETRTFVQLACIKQRAKPVDRGLWRSAERASDLHFRGYPQVDGVPLFDLIILWSQVRSLPGPPEKPRSDRIFSLEVVHSNRRRALASLKAPSTTP